jgi:CRISPR-associated exonuclease Cas4
LKGSGFAAIVDFKLTSGDVGENHRMQLAGYAVLVESVLGLAVERAFLFRIPDNKVFVVPVGRDLRERVVEAVRDIGRLRETEELPDATAVSARCAECEYANYCGDIW